MHLKAGGHGEHFNWEIAAPETLKVAIAIIVKWHVFRAILTRIACTMIVGIASKCVILLGLQWLVWTRIIAGAEISVGDFWVSVTHLLETRAAVGRGSDDTCVMCYVELIQQMHLTFDTI